MPRPAAVKGRSGRKKNLIQVVGSFGKSDMALEQSGFRVISKIFALLKAYNTIKTDLNPPNPLFQHSSIPSLHPVVSGACGKANLL
jgi:hypothetical protein